MLLERLEVLGLARSARAHRLAIEDVARSAVVGLDQPRAVGAVAPPECGGDVGLLYHLAVLRQLHQLLERAGRRPDRVFLAGERDGAVAQRDADRDRVLDLSQVGIITTQQGERVEMLDGESFDGHGINLLAGKTQNS